MIFVRLMLIAMIAGAVMLAGCSREQGDWKAAQSADTIEAYSNFLRKHQDATEAPDARTRVEQLGEQRDWQRASTTDTRETYAQFIALHPNSQWTQEARIRIENFALGPVVAAKPAPMPTPAQVPTAPSAPPPSRTREPAPAAAPVHESAAVRASVKPAGTPPVRGGQKVLQFGAFNSEAIARDSWAKLVRKYAALEHLQPRTEGVSHDGKTLYRLRTAAPDGVAAERICASLKASGEACLVVPDRR